MAEGNDTLNPFKVKLVRASAPTDISETIIFDVTPDIVENRNVNYKTYDPVHMPGQIYVYGNTNARTFSVNGIKLISRTPREATLNIFRTNTLRAWTMPRFGSSENVNGQFGAPPAVLLFSAYSDNRHPRNIYRIPVLIQNLSISYPSEPDYMPSAISANMGPHLRDIEEGTPFPTVTNVDMQLLETHSPNEYTRFSLEDFKTGNLNFY